MQEMPQCQFPLSLLKNSCICLEKAGILVTIKYNLAKGICTYVIHKHSYQSNNSRSTVDVF